MSLPTHCVCGQPVHDPNQARCSHCGRFLAIGADEPPPPAPAAPPPPQHHTPPLARMWLALLDPRSISAMLLVGGGLSVLGLVIWLTSLGVFDNPRTLAIALGGGTLTLVLAGWAMTLRTRHKLAGRALTFLGTVVAPLNLWFYHAQGLVTVEQGLWMYSVVCCLLFAATVFTTREPLFLYAVEVGVTLTVVLFLGQQHLAADVSYLVFALLSLSVVSLAAVRAFAAEAPVFSRRKFGRPAYVSGHVQLALALGLLMAVQWLSHGTWPEGAGETRLWLAERLSHSVIRLGLLAESLYLAAAVWIAAAVVYFVCSRRTGRSAPTMTWLGTGCLCGALWEMLIQLGAGPVYFAPLFGLLGVVALAVGRVRGTAGERVASCGHAVLLVSLTSAALQGLMRLIVIDGPLGGWQGVLALLAATTIGLVAMLIAGQSAWRRTYTSLSAATCVLLCITLAMLSQLTGWQKTEIAVTGIGLLMVVAGYVGRLREDAGRPDDTADIGLWIGSLLAAAPAVIAVLHYRFTTGGLSLIDELAVVLIAAAMLITGMAWRVKATTLQGGASLAIYVAVVLISLGWRQQWAIGVYLGLGGAALFAIGIALSIFGDRLVQLQQKFANREGPFQVLSWR